MDNVAKEIRSKIMSAVRPRGNKTTEIAFGKLLWAAGLLGYRKHWPIPGKPDFELAALRERSFASAAAQSRRPSA
jgi:G:T-mismatch repair DNA endonuclease (very short patch repair protein)